MQKTFASPSFLIQNKFSVILCIVTCVWVPADKLAKLVSFLTPSEGEGNVEGIYFQLLRDITAESPHCPFGWLTKWILLMLLKRSGVTKCSPRVLEQVSASRFLFHTKGLLCTRTGWKGGPGSALARTCMASARSCSWVTAAPWLGPFSQVPHPRAASTGA